MAGEHSSKIHPGLDKSPGKNWIDKLPKALKVRWKRSWIYRAAKHMVADKGMSVGRAVSTAVNAAKKGCATGDLNFSGKQSVNPKSQAQMCASVKLWTEMKASTKTDNSDEDLDDAIFLSELEEYDIDAGATSTEEFNAFDYYMLEQAIDDDAIEGDDTSEVEMAEDGKSWSTSEWNPKKGDYSEEQWKSATLLDGKLPVKEPDGTYNKNGVKSAAKMLSQVDGISDEQRKSTAKTLQRLFKEMGEEVPESIRLSEFDISAERYFDIVDISEREQASRMSLSLPTYNFSDSHTEGPKRWVKEILRAGKINYKGRSVEFKPEDLKLAVENFHKNALDYVPFQFVDEHNQHSDSPTLNAGTVEELRLSKNGQALEAVFNLNDQAQSIIATNPKFGVSVTYHPNYYRESDDKRFGPTLLSVAGTNRPRIPAMDKWIEASEHQPYGAIDLSEAEWDVISVEDDENEGGKELSEQEKTGAGEEGTVNLSAEEIQKIRDDNEALRGQVVSLSESRVRDKVDIEVKQAKENGVPPAIADRVGELMFSVRTDNDDQKIELSDGDGNKTNQSRYDMLTNILRECKGYVNLSDEEGSSDDGSEDTSGARSEADKEAIAGLVGLASS